MTDCIRGEIVVIDDCSVEANAMILWPVRFRNNIEVEVLGLIDLDFFDDNHLLFGLLLKQPEYRMSRLSKV